eukprot:403340731
MFEEAFDNSIKLQNKEKNSKNESDVHELFNLTSSAKKNQNKQQKDSYGSNNLISTLMEEVRYFMIDRKRFEFDDEDQIFYRESPMESRNLENGHSSCLCCETKFKSAKSANYCTFCGYPFCKLCVLKSMPFPKNNPDYKQRGQICKICDRKFYIREMMKASKLEIEMQQMAIQSLQDQLIQKDQECKVLDNDHEIFVEKARIDKDKLKDRKQDLKKQKKQLENECASMNDECKTLFERRSNIQTEQDELTETIKTIKEELEDLEEKLLRVNLNINKAVNEKSRMEDELKKYTKMLKAKNKNSQPKQNQHQQQNAGDSNKNSLVESQQLMSSTHSNDKTKMKSTNPNTNYDSLLTPNSAQTDGADYLNNSRTLGGSFNGNLMNTIGSPEQDNNRLNTFEDYKLGNARMSITSKKGGKNSRKGRGSQQQTCCADNNTCHIY